MEKVNHRTLDSALRAELLVRYEVGVQVQQRVVLHRMDEDFFDSIG